MKNHPLNPLVHNLVPLDARHTNALFGFPDGKKVPADFQGNTSFNGHTIMCLRSRPGRHRMFTHCPCCRKWFTVGCLPQHMRTMHSKFVWQPGDVVYGGK